MKFTKPSEESGKNQLTQMIHTCNIFLNQYTKVIVRKFTVFNKDYEEESKI